MIASYRASAAVVVLLPLCLEQFNIILFEFESRKDCCQGSGSKPKNFLAKPEGCILARLRVISSSAARSLSFVLSQEFIYLLL